LKRDYFSRAYKLQPLISGDMLVFRGATTVPFFEAKNLWMKGFFSPKTIGPISPKDEGSCGLPW